MGGRAHRNVGTQLIQGGAKAVHVDGGVVFSGIPDLIPEPRSPVWGDAWRSAALSLRWVAGGAKVLRRESSPSRSRVVAGHVRLVFPLRR